MLSKLKNVALAVCAAVSVMFNAYAANSNPMTGDNLQKYMWIVLPALGISLVVIIIIAATSGKKKK